MKKRLSAALLVLVLAALSGCAPTVVSRVSEKYPFSTPQRVAVLPITWEVSEEEDEAIGRLFRAMTVDAASSLNFRPLPPEAVDKALVKYSGDLRSLPPEEAARLTGADSVLYIRIREWRSGLLLTYAYLEMNAAFDLYSRDGTLLWSAQHSTRESDIKLDRTAMELAVVKVYEPRVQRFVTAVFSTLPPLPKTTERKTYYEWLP